MASSDVGGLWDRRVEPTPMRVRKRTCGWSDGSGFPLGAVRFNRAVGEEKGGWGTVETSPDMVLSAERVRLRLSF